MIRLENVSYSYPDGSPALKNINLEIKEGEFLGVIGRNGSGKSTLALHLNGLLKPEKGKVTVRGLDTQDLAKLPEIRKLVGIVFQNAETQFISRTLEEDLAFGPENLCLPPAEIRVRVERALEKTGLGKYRYHSPKTLSGGQAQYAALAGVLAMEPECLVFDEVSSALDQSSCSLVLKSIEKLWKNGKTIVYVTHNLEELHAADRVILMDRGKIVLEGCPEEIFSAEVSRRSGIFPPSLVDLATRLRASGINVPWEKVRFPETFAEELCRLFSKT
jgi:energy-coupling factor transport system ATP-binding protein